MYGVTTRYVQQAKAVYEADQTLAHKVHQGEITVTAALKAIEERQNPPQIEPSRDHPNRVHRDHLKAALKLSGRLEELVQMITRYSRPPVPDEVAWAREVELKQRLTRLCAMIPKLCVNEVGEPWNEAQAAESNSQGCCG
jgi:hypothetical protein